MPRYSLAGLGVDCAFELAGAPRSSAEVVDLLVERAQSSSPPIAHWLLEKPFRGSTTPWLSVAKAAGGYLVRVHGEADFVIDAEGTRVEVRPIEEGDDASIAQLFLDQVLPQVLELRGCLALHASAIAIDARAVGFLGTSGAGKSTLTASFGLPVLSDDCLVVTRTDPVLALASYSATRLTESSARALEPSTTLPLASPRSTKRRLARPTPTTLAPELAALYLLAEGPRVELRRLSRRDAIVRVAEHVHRLDPLRDLGGELDRLEHLASHARIAELSYPRAFEALPRVRALVLGDAAA